MAIYHCSISNVSRASGSSSCASLSYIIGKSVYDERKGKNFAYGRQERVLHVNTILPEQAPQEYANPATLFNAIEHHEKAENARTAKKIEVALPRELTLQQQVEVVENFIRHNLTEQGYCATYAIHNDKKNNNPHAHIIVANRQIDERGEWIAVKGKKQYALDEHGEKIPLIDPETGQQKVRVRKGKGVEKLWVRETVDQNPLDKKEVLQQLRAGWAAECNLHLDERSQIDHRSNKDRKLWKVPTIHEGYAAREIEKRGETSDRMEINREIAAKNKEILRLTRQAKEVEKQEVRVEQPVSVSKPVPEAAKEIVKPKQKNAAQRTVERKESVVGLLAAAEKQKAEREAAKQHTQKPKKKRDLPSL